MRAAPAVAGLALAWVLWLADAAWWVSLAGVGVGVAITIWREFLTVDRAQAMLLGQSGYDRLPVEQGPRYFFGVDDPIRSPPNENTARFEAFTQTMLDCTGPGSFTNPADLPMWARVMLLPDLVGINPGGKLGLRRFVPAYGLMRVAGDYGPGSSFAYKPRGFAPDLAEWVKLGSRVFALLGQPVCFSWLAREGAVVVSPCSADHPSVGLFVGLPPPLGAPQAVTEELGEVDPADLPESPYRPLSFVSADFPAGHLAEGSLYIGDVWKGQPEQVWLELGDLTHMLVVGISGTGKSVFLRQMLEGVKRNRDAFEAVHLVDLKGGVELFPYEAQAPGLFRVVYRLEHLAPLVADLVNVVHSRLDEMRRAGIRKWKGKRVLFVVDEYAQIQQSPSNTKEERAARDALLGQLNILSMLGRAAGVLIWAQLQKATTDSMDSSFRNNLQSLVCFRVPNKLTAASMFGTTDELAVDPTKLLRGRFIFYDDSAGETMYLQARQVEDDGSR